MRLFPVFDPEDEGEDLYKWLFKRDEILIDNVVFYLHYHFTSAFFLIGCVIVTILTYIMDPIDCISDKSVDEIIDSYCLYHSTYTILNTEESDKTLVAHPGVHVSVNSESGAVNEKFHSYYLWVAIVLAIQALSFYIPRGVWKGWEGSRVSMMLEEIDKFIAYDDEKGDNEQQKPHDLIKYIKNGNHNSYYWKLLSCEFFNLVNAIFQLFITNLFLGFGMLNLGLDFLQLFQEKPPFHRSDAVEQMFPKVTKCVFYSYGPSGSITTNDSLCILSVNAVNEKIFIILLVWLLLLTAISFLAFAYRILLFLIPSMRIRLLKFHLQSEEIEGLKALELNIGNMQLLHQLAGNQDVESWKLTKIVKHLIEFKKN